MSLDVMKQALEALEFLALENFVELDKSLNVGPTHGRKAIIALRAAIEQAEKQEPHSLLCVCGAEWDIYPDGNEVLAATAPRQWQGLTSYEIWQCNTTPPGSDVGYHICMAHQNVLDFAEAIEAKLKEKNT